MKIFINFLIIILTLISYCSSISINIYPKIKYANNFLNFNDDDDNKPLFLTSYIESNKLDEAKKLSKVNNLLNNLESYSGFLTVNKTYDSNMFFWFFPSLNGKIKDIPILLWLQGGPGATSLFGLFVENGPLKIQSDGKTAMLRNYTWNKEFALLYIDNPVGAGFSFTKNENGYAKNEDDVAENLYEALRQFFILFSEYRSNPFFLTGESYAGKYLPSLGYKIHQMNKIVSKPDHINLQGFIIGGGFCDPRHMFNYGDFLFQIGLIDKLQLKNFKIKQNLAIYYIDNGEMKKAAQIFDELISADIIKYSDFYNATGLKYYYNFLYDKEPEDFSYYDKYLSLLDVRKSIHVGNLTFGDVSNNVELHLINDIMTSVTDRVEKLLNANYRMLFYGGQLDIIVATPLIDNFLKYLNWFSSNDYHQTKRLIYRIHNNENDENHIVGYIKNVHNLYRIVIRNAGHILPYDQPMISLDMITRFVKNESFC